MAVLPKATPERLSTFSDGVFAVVITVLVLELRPPEDPRVAALVALKYPLAGLGICICCLSVYLKPDRPETRRL
jgi:uncharacterized membrane protein